MLCMSPRSRSRASLKIMNSVTNSRSTSFGVASGRAMPAAVITIGPSRTRLVSKGSSTWAWYHQTIEHGSAGPGPLRSSALQVWVKLRATSSARAGRGQCRSAPGRIPPLRRPCRLLLRHTVERAEPEHQISGVNADHAPPGEELGEGLERLPVARVVEGRDQHRRVSDVEVRVAGRQALAVEDDGRGHRQLHDPERRRVLIGHACQALAVLPQRVVVRVGGVLLARDDDGTRVDEAREVVDVAVRVVARDAAAEPEDLAHAEVGVERALQRRALHPRVPRLHRREKALLGGEERAAPVHVDAAALEDEPRLPLPAPEELRQPAGYGVVALPVGVLRPAVELPVGVGDLAVVAAYEERAEVARPRAVGRHAEELDATRVDAGAREDAPGAPLGRRVADEDAHALARDQVAYDRGVDPGDGGELPRPVAPLVGPGEPGGRMRLPLRWHAVAERGRRRHRDPSRAGAW